jgi:hypothetical protein
MSGDIKPGDTVRLIDRQFKARCRRVMKAKLGALATVKSVFTIGSTVFLSLEWQDGKARNGQPNGNYRASRFEKVT